MRGVVLACLFLVCVSMQAKTKSEQPAKKKYDVAAYL